MAFVTPENNIAHLKVTHGMNVADFGAGVGINAFLLSERVGGDGHVFAVDIMREQLVTLKNHAKERGIKNIEIVHGDLEAKGGSNLADASIDAIVVSNIFFQVELKDAFIEEMRRVLKKDGRVMLVDWTDSFEHMGPHPDHIVTLDTAKKIFIKSGFSVVEEFDAGDHHYGLILGLHE